MASKAILAFDSRFEDAWNNYANLWGSMVDRNMIIEQAISIYIHEERINSVKEYERWINHNVTPTNVPKYLEKQVRLENIPKIVDEQSKRRFAFVKPIEDSLTTILAHSIFESILRELLAIGLTFSSTACLLKYHSQKQVPIESAFGDSPESVIREILIKKHERSSLKEIQDMIINISNFEDKVEATRILSYYKVDFEEILSIDSSRQEIIHQVKFESLKEISELFEILEKAAGCFGNLIANCVGKKSYAHVHYAFISGKKV